MAERRFRYCEQIFQPSKYQPGQLVCSDSGCQRRRRDECHRQKIAADPEYRQVCLDSPQKWRSRNPDYWRRYREQHPAAVERNRHQQHVRDQKRRLRDLANNNSALAQVCARDAPICLARGHSFIGCPAGVGTVPHFPSKPRPSFRRNPAPLRSESGPGKNEMMETK